MSDTALQNAEKRRDEIAAEINRLQARIDEKKKELERVKQFLADYQSFAAGLPELQFGPPPPKSPLGAKKPTNRNRAEIGDLVEQIIREAGRPMGREELFRALQERGIQIVGKDPRMVFSTMMWRMQDRFVRLQGHGYWLAKRFYSPAGYFPPPPV